MTYAEIREAAEQSALKTEARLLRKALAENEWKLTVTAKALECSPSTLFAAVQRHPDLAARIPARGRPRGKR